MAQEDLTAVLRYEQASGKCGHDRVVEASEAALRSGRIPDLGIPESLRPTMRQVFPPAGSITLIDAACATPVALDTYIEKPGIGCLFLEPGTDADADATADRIAFAVRLNALVVSLPGAVFMESGMARRFCQGLSAHVDVSGVNLTTIELSLQEAIINAVVHGNLGLGSAYRETGDDLKRYHGMIRERLDNDPAARKRVDVVGWWSAGRLNIAVGDQGNGYQTVDRRKRQDPEKTPPQHDRRRSGRGLEIIRRFAEQVTVTNGGRMIVMEFAR